MVSVTVWPLRDAEPLRPQKRAGLSSRVYCTSGAEKLCPQRLPTLVGGIHREDMEVRGSDQVVFVRQKERIQIVD